MFSSRYIDRSIEVIDTRLTHDHREPRFFTNRRAKTNLSGCKETIKHFVLKIRFVLKTQKV